jgi:hypothetical protein
MKVGWYESVKFGKPTRRHARVPLVLLLRSRDSSLREALRIGRHRPAGHRRIDFPVGVASLSSSTTEQKAQRS